MKRGFLLNRGKRERFAKSAKGAVALLALVFFIASSFSPFCFAQEYFIHTSKEDFQSGIPENVDPDSSPGDVKLALKAKPVWWDENWSGRFKIQIKNNEGADLPAGYTVSLVIDHASLVAAGASLENGNDVRVIYQPDGEDPPELDRVLEADSSWNNAGATILFKTQAAISDTDSDYFLYFNNLDAGDSPSNPRKVFAFFEDFEEIEQLEFSEWGECSGDWCRTKASVLPEISSEQAYFSSKSLKLTGRGRDSAVYINSPVGQDYTVTARFYTSDSDTEAGLYFRGGIFSNLYPHFGFFWARRYQFNNGSGIHLYNDSCPPLGCPPPKESEWNTLRVKVVGKEVLEIKMNGNEIWWNNQPETLEVSDTQGERVGFYYRRSQPLYYDDLALKLAVGNEPTLTLTEEQDEYESLGSLISSPFDAQGQVGWDRMTWEEILPEETAIYFQVAASNDGETWSDWSENLTDASGSSLSFLSESRLIKYKAVLQTDDFFATPVLQEVKIFSANSPPKILRLELTSSDSPHTYTTSILTAEVSTFDEDGDEVALDFVWYENGNEISGAPNADSLTGTYFQKGDEVSVKVTPSDGKTTGASLQSGPKIIENTVPSTPVLVSPGDEAITNTNPPTLTWDASDDSDADTLNYQVEIDSQIDFSPTLFYIPDITLTEGEYFWRVKVSDGEDESSWSEIFKFTLDVTKPETSFVKKPGDKTTETSVEFTWAGTDNISTSLLFSFRLDGEAWSEFEEITTIVFDNLTDGNHTFEVRAKDEAGNTEDTASFFWEIDTIPPFLPSSFSAEAGDGKVSLSWTEAADSDLAGYNLYRSVDEENDFKKINSGLITTLEFTDTNVENGKKYFYKMTAVDKLGNESGNSSAVGVTPQGKTVIIQTEPETETEKEIKTEIETEMEISVPQSGEGEVLGEAKEEGVESDYDFRLREGSKSNPDAREIFTRIFKISALCAFLSGMGYLVIKSKRS